MRAPVWHSGLMATQSDTRAVHAHHHKILYMDSGSSNYQNFSMHRWRGRIERQKRTRLLCERLSKKHLLPSSSQLYYLFPDQRDNDTVNRDIINLSIQYGQSAH